MMTLADIKKLVSPEFYAVDQMILNSISSEIPLAEKIAAHVVQSGGKRIRPLLVLLSAKALNYKNEDHIKLATIIELLHTATLLHDDVIDESALRRGRKTANAEWGNEVSVLVGDFLYARTFQLIAEIKHFSIIELIAAAGSYIVEGEVLQLVHCHDGLTTEATYFEIIKRKTGRLFSVATSSVAVLMNQPKAIIDTLSSFGENLGMAFQMLDDALDYDADPVLTGKNLGDDLNQGKPTLPLLYTLHHGSEEEQQIIRAALAKPKTANLAEIISLMQKNGAIEYAKQQAQSYIQHAISDLKPLPSSPARDALAALATLAGNRQQ